MAESTNASTTALLDPVTRTWHDDLIHRVGLPRGLFAELVGPGTELGALTPEMARELARARGGCGSTAVGSHDTASAVVAVPMTRPDAAYISCGTWGLVGLELEHPVMTDAAREANFTNEGGVDGRVRFLHNVTGLWLLSESIRAWEAAGERIDLAQLLADAAAVAEPVAIIDANDPRFAPPGDMPARIEAAIRENGDAVPTTPAGLARVIIESLAVAFAETVHTAARLADREVRVDPHRRRRIAQRAALPAHRRPLRPAGAGWAGRGDGARQRAHPGPRSGSGRHAGRAARARRAHAPAASVRAARLREAVFSNTRAADLLGLAMTHQ